MKIGLPNYSNIDISFGMTVEVKEGEELNYNECWDTVNKQLYLNSKDIDPSWIKTNEYQNFFKTVIKTNKGGI